jgi:hypothetical protein
MQNHWPLSQPKQAMSHLSVEHTSCNRCGVAVCRQQSWPVTTSVSAQTHTFLCFLLLLLLLQLQLQLLLLLLLLRS